MSNNLTLFAGNKGKIALKGAKGMAAALKDSAADGNESPLPDGGVYISFSGKMGKYSIGQDKEDADPNEIWLVNVYSFEAGWICWKGGSPAARRLGSIYEEPVPTPDFDQHGPFNSGRGEGWHKAKAMMLRSLDRGIQGYFGTNTKSAVKEFAKLEGEVARRLEEGLPAWPIVNLEKEQFTAQGQKNFKPILSVVGWLGMRQVNEMASMEDIDEIAESIDRLMGEAEEDEENGVMDTTMDSSDAADDQPDTGAADDVDTDGEEDGDGIEDAEIVEEDEEEEAEEEPAKPARTTASRRAGKAGARAATKPAGGLAGRQRRNRAKV